MKNITEFLKKYKEISRSIIIVSILVASYGIFRENFSREDFDSSLFWQNYWTVEAAVITAVLAVIGILFEIDTNKKAKKEDERKEEERLIKDAEKAQLAAVTEAYEVNLTAVNLEGSSALIEWNEYLENRKDFTDKKIELKSKIVVVLYKYSMLKKSREELDDVNKQGNMSDYLQDRNLIKKIISHPDFKQVKEEIEDEFPDLRDIINVFIDNNPQAVKNEKLGVVDIQKYDENNEYPYILGDWIMKEDYAKQAKYLIGVSMRNRKEIVAIYKITDTKNINDRIRFKGDLLFNRDDNDGEVFVKTLANWTSRNPVLYYNMWGKNLEGYKTLLDIIASLEKQDKANFEKLNSGNRDIVVVATNQYDNRVTSNEVREIIPTIFSEEKTDKMEKQKLVSKLKEIYPYLNNHTGIYEGVFNKLDDSEKTFIYQNNEKNKRLRRFLEEPKFRFVDVEEIEKL